MTGTGRSHVAADGVRLHVEIAGPDNAPTVVLVHGLAASIAIGWQATGVLDRLSAGGLRTVAYDARGHGRSDSPPDPARYGDSRLAADLAEIVNAYAGSGAVVAGYSMGASTALFALTAGLGVRGAVIGGAPTAVLRWTDADEMLRSAAIAALEGGDTADAAMQMWIAFLDATGADKAALAACLRGHRPVVEGWDRINVPMIVAAGVDDAGAAPLPELVSLLTDARPLVLPGDHFVAPTTPAFTDAIINLAKSSA